MQGDDGLIRQVPSEKESIYLDLAYQKGSQITGLMDDNGIGKLYADDFIQYICKNEKNIADKKILEIGSGTGYLLYELKKLGAEVLGVEPGEHGIEGSKKYGVPVINSFFNPLEVTEKYDIVIFYAVLEHMQDAGGFLRDVKSVLSKNGKIVLAVPDCGPYIQAGDISLLVHEHWNYFTKDTLEVLAANNGLSGNVVRSEFAGALYAFFDEVGDDKIILASERNTLSAYMDKVEMSKEKIFNYIESVMQSQSLGIYVLGRVDDEYTVGVLHASSGEYINSIAVKKNILSGLSNKTRVANRTGRKDLGDILAISSGVSQGEIGRFEEVTKPCREIARKLAFTAALNIQCRVHNGQMYVFEINPRISGTSSLRAMVGYNEPDILIREKILGEVIEPDFIYKSGYIARGLSECYISRDFMDTLEYSKIS